MARASARFTQAEVSRLLAAAKSSGFNCVTIEVLPDAAGLRATYTLGASAKGATPAIVGTPVDADDGLDPDWGLTPQQQVIASAFDGLSHREQRALEHLASSKRRDIPVKEMKGIGIVTWQTLERLGYVTLTKEGDRVVSWRMTDEGHRFMHKVNSLPPYSYFAGSSTAYHLSKNRASNAS